MVDIDLLLLMRCERKDGFFAIQPEPFGGPKAGARAYEALFPYGLFGYPLEPDAPTTKAGDVQPSRLGAAGLVLSWEDEKFVLPTTDPRVTPILPDPGQGGAGFKGAYHIGTTVHASYVVFFGEGAAATPVPSPLAAGSMRLRVDDAEGKHFDIEIDRESREIRIWHPDDTTAPAIVVKPGPIIELGGIGAMPLMVDPGTVTAFFAAASAAFTALGQSVPAPTGFLSQHVKAKV